MHSSGQISGRVPDKAGAMSVGLSQQNRNSYQAQMHHIGGQRKLVMDHDLLKARRFMQEKIYECLMQRQPQSNELPTRKIIDIVKRLEDGLFKTASTKEEYMNLDTLESRLHVFIKRTPMSTSNPQQQQFVSPSPVGTMIPTPGMPHHGSSNSVVSSSVETSAISSSGCNNLPSSGGASGNLLPVVNGLLPSVHDGALHMFDGGNIISSMGDQRVMSQMIPTPGFNNSSDTLMSMEVDGNANGVSSATSSLTSQRVPVTHPSSAQSNRMTQSFGNQIDSRARSIMRPRSYASIQNVSASGGFGSYEQPFIGSSSSESYSTTTAAFGGSSRSSQQQFDQQSQPLVQGDGCGLNVADSVLRSDFSGLATSAGALTNNQYLDSARSHPSPKSNLLIGGHSNVLSTQPDVHLRPQSSDGSEKYNSNHSVQSPRGSYLLPHRQLQHQPSPQFQQQQMFLHRQGQQNLAGQQHPGTLKSTRLQSSSDFSAHVKAEPSVEHLNEALQLSEFQTQFQKQCAENQPASNQISSLPSVSNEFCSSLPQNSQNMLQPHQFAAEEKNQYDCLLPLGVQSETSMQGNWHPDSDKRSSAGNSVLDQKVQSELRHRLIGHDDAQYNSLPTAEGSTGGEDGVIRGAGGALGSGGALNRSFNSYRDRQFFNQQKWLLILRHARSCKEPEGKCSDYCFAVRKLWRHIDSCSASHCTYPRCQRTKSLILHNKRCRSPQCPVCVPVNNRLMAEWKKIRLSRDSGSGLQNQGYLSGSFKASNAAASARDINGGDALQPSSTFFETAEADSQLSVKRLKTELPSYGDVQEGGNTFVALNSSTESHPTMDVGLQGSQNNDNKPVLIKSEAADVNMVACRNSVPTTVDKKDSFIGASRDKFNDDPILNDNTSYVKQEIVKNARDAAHVKQEDILQSSDHGVETKSGKPKIKGVSLTELFTPEQVREHIRGLRRWVGQSKAKAEKNQAMERSMSENSCQLCAVEKLTFEPPPIYCTKCNSRIKRNALYYTAGTGDTRHYICVACYSGGDPISIDGAAISKSRFEKKKNDEETEEWWVQCDKCEAWQHQICALFNGRRNDGGQAEYTCPNCYIQEVENGERKPLPQSALLGAKDLPRTHLSDYIEQRLFKKLKDERQKRAAQEGKSYDEVPGAEGLVVRVVSSVDKKLDVKPRFLEIFQEENYPAEFPYKSKVVLLFQKIEGVEVCLFGMYVQEFGSECLPPNQRRVYLSYLDSVKYFRPEVRAVTGETVRTVVYHEILIGYLDYCKKRGFTSCYIWACPPIKGEDYILYCHPEIQKIPKPDKLREWYLSMLRKACKENIVVELTNLYDHFFVSTGECKAKVTAARLPYFDGDYWPGAAEETIEQLNREDDGRKHNKKGMTKKMFTKRTLKASGQFDLSSNASKDTLLMHRLGETIHPMKDVFIMVHLQHSCTHCCELMVSGNRWVCKQCKNFQICDKCYEAEQGLDERERHPIGHKEKHALHPIEIAVMPEDTKDMDEILESEFFDTRQAFLSLCQGNHYQFDTLRRAKHSSMMVLYHLHNPTAPAYVTTCNICHLDIETGQGWRCETCPEYDVCNACYQKEGGIDHPHKLTSYPSLADRDAQSTEARQLRVLQLRRMLDLLVHASQCRSLHCQYPNCRKVKGLFRHGISCRTRASGGCALCKKMWYLLQLHARACKESECHVPRCRDLRDHLKRLQQQSDSRRRAAVVEMMRQRAAEGAGNAG